jgi:5,10-methylenetetrahydrofolate reductase
MPITNYTQLVRFSNMCGAKIPSWILKKLELYQDDLDSQQQCHSQDKKALHSLQGWVRSQH